MEFKQRLLDEKQQLDERIGKLGSFIETETFKGLDPIDQELLRCQHSEMQPYASTLKRRIERLT
jgi:transcription termination factor NusB